MLHRSLTPLAVLASTVALAIAGCGGGDDSTTASTTAALTAEQWATQADQICAQGDKDQRAAVSQFLQEQGLGPNDQPTGAQFQQLATEVVIPSIEDQINAIKALPIPEDASDQVQQFLDQAQADLDKLKADPNQIIDESAFDDTEKLARDLGLQHCASG
jgi:hypothetical protein